MGIVVWWCVSIIKPNPSHNTYHTSQFLPQPPTTTHEILISITSCWPTHLNPCQRLEFPCNHEEREWYAKLFLSVLCSFIVFVPPNYKYLNLFYILLGYTAPLPTWHPVFNLSPSSIPCSVPLTYDLTFMCFLPLMYGQPWSFTNV